MNPYYLIFRWFANKYFRLFHRLTVIGIDSPYHGKAILAPNHASYFDPPLITVAWPEEVHFLARSSLFKNRLQNWVFSKLNAHPVKGDGQDLDSLRFICKLLDEGKQVVIFPEGRRTRTGEIQPIKPGIAMLAIRTNSPIIPVYIKGAFEAFPRHKRFPKFGTPLTCIFGKPIFPDQFQEKNKKKLQELMTRQVQEQWGQAF